MCPTSRPQASTTVPVTSVATAGAPHYDCNVGYSRWKAEWSVAKKMYCCDKVQTGCPVKGTINVDCQTGFETWHTGWGVAKKELCCKHWEWTTEWPVDTRDFCCILKQVGCAPQENKSQVAPAGGQPSLEVLGKFRQKWAAAPGGRGGMPSPTTAQTSPRGSGAVHAASSDVARTVTFAALLVAACGTLGLAAVASPTVMRWLRSSGRALPAVARARAAAHGKALGRHALAGVGQAELPEDAESPKAALLSL